MSRGVCLPVDETFEKAIKIRGIPKLTSLCLSKFVSMYSGETHMSPEDSNVRIVYNSTLLADRIFHQLEYNDSDDGITIVSWKLPWSHPKRKIEFERVLIPISTTMIEFPNGSNRQVLIDCIRGCDGFFWNREFFDDRTVFSYDNVRVRISLYMGRPLQKYTVCDCVQNYSKPHQTGQDGDDLEPLVYCHRLDRPRPDTVHPIHVLLIS